MPQGIVAPDVVRNWVSQLAIRLGTKLASKKLSLGKETIARLMAGLPVQMATISHVERLMEAEK